MVELSGQSLGQLLDLMAGARAAPAAGSAAGWSLAIAGALLAKTARLSHRQLSDWSDHAEEADSLRSAGLELADDDAAAVTAMIQAAKHGAETESVGSPPPEALDVPRKIRDLAGQIDSLATLLTSRGNPWLYADAETARLLATSVAQVAETLIHSNEG